MPSMSQKQHNAMMAAAGGKSTIGIPKKVGQDFAAADKGKKFPAASVSKSLRKKKPDPEGEAMDKGGYSKGHGMGSG
jgi:hypothetical protein